MDCWIGEKSRTSARLSINPKIHLSTCRDARDISPRNFWRHFAGHQAPAPRLQERNRRAAGWRTENQGHGPAGGRRRQSGVDRTAGGKARLPARQSRAAARPHFAPQDGDAARIRGGERAAKALRLTLDPLTPAKQTLAISIGGN